MFSTSTDRGQFGSLFEDPPGASVFLSHAPGGGSPTLFFFLFWDASLLSEQMQTAFQLNRTVWSRSYASTLYVI